jgi:hypothetical protein
MGMNLRCGKRNAEINLVRKTTHTEHKFKVFDKKEGLNKWKWRVI